MPLYPICQAQDFHMERVQGTNASEVPMKRFTETLQSIAPFMLSFNILTVGLTVSFLGLSAEAKSSPTLPQPKSFSFSYKSPGQEPFKITVQSPNYDSAFRLAAKECYKSLSNGQYPGESRGLAMIDICANPK